MRIVPIAYGQVIEDAVAGILGDNSIAGWTTWRGIIVDESVEGGIYLGGRSGPSLNDVLTMALNNAWPRKSCAAFVNCEGNAGPKGSKQSCFLAKKGHELWGGKTDEFDGVVRFQ
jgi:hypothetical protein